MGRVRRVALILLLCPALLGSCSARIEHGLDEASANGIILALERAGIPASKEAEPGSDTFSVSVPGRAVGQALEVLRAEGLPRRPEVGLEAFDEPGWVPTATEERARYEHALAGELARSIESLDGVLDARVHVSVPARDALLPSDSPPPRPRASVLIQVDGKGSPLGTGDVRALVTGAIQGLAAEDVSVVVARRSTTRTPRTRPPPRVVSAVWLGVATLLIAGLAVALLISVAYGRALRRRIRAHRTKGERE